LIDIIHGVDDTRKQEYYDSLESLADRLRHPMDRLSSLVVLCPGDASELARLTNIGHLLRDMRVILLLPDGRAKTVTRGHMLRPRFVGYADGDLSEVAAVVKKMSFSRPQPTLRAAHP
jgi:hypothetical protein